MISFQPILPDLVRPDYELYRSHTDFYFEYLIDRWTVSFSFWVWEAPPFTSRRRTETTTLAQLSAPENVLKAVFFLSCGPLDLRRLTSPFHEEGRRRGSSDGIGFQQRLLFPANVCWFIIYGLNKRLLFFM